MLYLCTVFDFKHFMKHTIAQIKGTVFWCIGRGLLCIVLVYATALFTGCKGSVSQEANKALKAAPSEAVEVRRTLFYNGDSLLHYARLAYQDEDPEGLYVTGAAAFLRREVSDFPDSCTTVSLDEAAVMLQRAAQLGHADANQLIHCLNANGVWKHSVPEPAK